MWVAVAVIVIGGFWWYSVQQMNYPSQTAQNQNSVNSAQDSSDQALTSDITAVDKETLDLNTDSANIDQGLNDQQIPQN